MNIARANRPLRIGRQGAVASNHPVASRAGLDVLRAGGNAADAAVAVALSVGVVEPHMSGLGADGFYHGWFADAAGGAVYNGSGFAPRAAVARHAAALPANGPDSVSIPGALGALGRLHARHGRMPWAELVAPAIEAARDGFGVSVTYRRFATLALELIRRHPDTARRYLHDGDVPPVGHFVVQPEVAGSLEMAVSQT